jgi:hypothetical protein
MQISGEGIENLFVKIMFKKIKTNLKDTIPCLFTWEWAKQILI